LDPPNTSALHLLRVLVAIFLMRSLAPQDIFICKTPTSLNILFIEIDHNLLASKIVNAIKLHL
jgi:hypothetical protein